MGPKRKKRNQYTDGTWAQADEDNDRITNESDEKDDGFKAKWQLFLTLGPFMCLMKKYLFSKIRFSPLIIHSVKVVIPALFWEDINEGIRSENYDEMITAGERLRWFRVQRKLSQGQLAKLAGMELRRYKRFENGRIKYFPRNELQRLAKILNVSCNDLVDDYMLFIYSGQKRQLKSRREALGMTVEAYAKHLHVDPLDYRTWESGTVRISRRTWEKHFRECDDQEGENE